MSHADRDLESLEHYQLVPRLLHDVVDVDSACTLLGRRLASPILPRLAADAHAEGGLALVDAARVVDAGTPWAVPIVRSIKMGALMPEIRRLTALDVPAIVLDVSRLGDSGPYGDEPWRPRTREDLAELAAAAGRPVWLYGIASPADATVAAEAGLDAVVVHGGAGRHLRGPATIDALPDIVDAVGGMLGVFAGGPVASGIDVYRYLAVGAEAVVVESDRSLHALEAELHYAMRLTGCSLLSDIGYDAIFAPLFGDA
jgi:isopentenyl diphosphate isomerase/L-lactate dehydrogenase-like FMN-dependent dehydrogenase